MGAVAARIPGDETARLAELRAYGVLDTPPEQRLDDLALLAARICGVPMAQINFVDAGRQWTKAAVGMGGGECSREDSFCAHTILEPDVLVVEDALADERFAGNRFVHGDPNIRFYAGAPLVSPAGHALGALCVIDSAPRRLQPEQEEALCALGRQVVTELELRRMLAAREQVVADLVELDRLRSEFVSLVTHELRNPLTSVCGFAELLLRESETLSANQRQAIEIIQRNGGRLLEMVEELLTGSQAASGALSVVPRAMDFAETARDVAERAQATADAKGVSLEVALPETVPFTGDPKRLCQALENLVSNAVKYTPTGGRVTFAVETLGDRVLAHVADTGIGVPEDEVDRLFGRFFRASSATEAGIPGTGLGLVVVKAVAEAHGGTVSVRSRPGHGTSFTLELPL